MFPRRERFTSLHKVSPRQYKTADELVLLFMVLFLLVGLVFEGECTGKFSGTINVTMLHILTTLCFNGRTAVSEEPWLYLKTIHGYLRVKTMVLSFDHSSGTSTSHQAAAVAFWVKTLAPAECWRRVAKHSARTKTKTFGADLTSKWDFKMSSTPPEKKKKKTFPEGFQWVHFCRRHNVDETNRQAKDKLTKTSKYMM